MSPNGDGEVNVEIPGMKLEAGGEDGGDVDGADGDVLADGGGVGMEVSAPEVVADDDLSGGGVVEGTAEDGAGAEKPEEIGGDVSDGDEARLGGSPVGEAVGLETAMRSKT